jgi:hypothetical protein
MGEFPNKDTQFKKGHEKLGGRKRGTSNYKTLIEKVFNEEIKDDGGDLVVKGLLAVKSMFDKAEKGDVSAFLALSNRMDGQPKATVEDTNHRVVIINRPPPRKRKTKSKA